MGVPNAPGAPTNQTPVLPSRTVVVNTRSVSLQEAIELALQHNFDIQIQRYTPQIARYSLGGAYGGWDPVISAGGQHIYSQSPGGIDPQGRTFIGNRSESDQFDAGISGLLPFGLNYDLGGRASDNLVTRPDIKRINPVVTPILGTNINNPNEVFTFGFETNYTEIPILSTTEDSTAHVGALTLSQPLLKNFWIDPTRANIQVAKNRLKYSEFALRLQMMNTVLAVEQAYYNLIFARENVKVQETALQLAERLLWENRKKVEVGQMAPLDEKQAESQVATSRADLLATQRVLDVQENILKNLITDDFRAWHNLRLIPAENLVAVPVALNLQEIWDNALRSRPDLIQARLDVQRNEINVRLDRNQLFPDLSLIGQYGYDGRDKENSGAFGQIQSQDNPFWYYGARINYPIGNRTARNNYKISKAQREQSQLILKQKEQAVLVSVDDVVKLVQTDFARVEATREARLFAQAALEAEQKKLENGKSTSFFVLQFQRDLTAAKFAEIQALAEYNNALAQLAFQQGVSLENRHLNVEVK
jgi:outer membrane protein TolC